MAVYDLEEQEQLDELKSWWGQYRMLVLLVIVAAAMAAGGTQAWRYYQNKQALEAGELYSQLQGAAGSRDARKVQDIAAVMTERYPGTSYAIFAALMSAKTAYDGADLATAKARLQWALENAKEDEIREIARLRLAMILLDEKHYDDALKMLEYAHSEAMSALYADLKGDVLVAQDKAPEARSAYQLALDKSDAKSAYRSMIQIKLDALGELK